jgi:N utilization substance protein B
MGARRRSRELAMQALFYMDSRQLFGPRYVALFCDSCPPKAHEAPLFHHLVNGVLNLRRHLDLLIEQFSSNWKISRMSCVDRNVIRMAVFEMICCSDIPAKVSINEAIDIGKKFGTEESGSFINGILDSIRKARDEGTLDLSAFPALPLGAEAPLLNTPEEADPESEPGAMVDQDTMEAVIPKRPLRVNPKVMKRTRTNSA